MSRPLAPSPLFGPAPIARHTLYLEDLAPSADRLTVEGPEADHARKVKRLEPGQFVTLLNGRGLVADAEVMEARRALVLRIADERVAERTAPAVDVWSATPKGPRSSDLVDALSQVGAASWRALDSARSVVEPGDNKMARLERVAHEACKQSLRAWTLDIHPMGRFDDALAPEPGVAIVLADASGEPYRAKGAARIRLIVGPEGGFTEPELQRARAAGAAMCRFGPHVMRIEVAAPVACAVVLDAEARTHPPSNAAPSQAG